MLYAIICTYRPGGGHDRYAFRKEHIEYMITARNRMIYGGTLASEHGQVETGLMVVLEALDRGEAETFIHHEPYMRAGLFESVEIRALRQIAPEPEPGLLERLLERELAAEHARVTDRTDDGRGVEPKLND